MITCGEAADVQLDGRVRHVMLGWIDLVVNHTGTLGHFIPMMPHLIIILECGWLECVLDIATWTMGRASALLRQSMAEFLLPWVLRRGQSHVKLEDLWDYIVNHLRTNLEKVLA